METVEHWWNQVVAGAARQDVFLQRLADDTWRVDWQWWPDRYDKQAFASESDARRFVTYLKDKAGDAPGRTWRLLGQRRRPER